MIGASDVHRVRGSFRDPGGKLFSTDSGVVRSTTRAAAEALEAFLQLPYAANLVERGRLVATARLDGPPPSLEHEGREGDRWFEHERIALPTYAYEWSPRMLHAAAALTLALAKETAALGFGLKDGTPDNVLFRRARPVFVDLLSFERRDPHDPTWLPYAQFVRTFLLPLLMHREFGLPVHQLACAARDGFEPEQLSHLGSWTKRFRQPLLSLVTVPTWLGKLAQRSEIYRPRRESNPDKAQFILQSCFKRLERSLRRVAPPVPVSAWTSYEAQHEAAYVERKTATVEELLRRLSPKRVLDLGCNTGQYSEIAARAGAAVVAMDSDPAVIDALWARASSDGLDIQTLVANIAQPSPATGWRNSERPALLDRLRGRFDTVFLLALLHHLLITERVPLPEVVDLVAQLTMDAAIVELVAPGDELFERLTRGRAHLHGHLTTAYFEQVARDRFEQVERFELLEGRRWLYLLRGRRVVPS